MADDNKEKISDEKEPVKEAPKEAVNQGVHNYLEETGYIRPTNPRTLKQLEWFQDQKLALMMHWGIYSQWGIVESWALDDADTEWSRNGVDWDTDIATFKRDYHDLYKTFNPVRFQPDKWAELAKDGGFKYLIFTTKHHDGFCMWDTKYTDYKITSEKCPYHTKPKADIVGNVFEAFRRKGLGIAAYFSKADWDTPYYWAKDKLKGNFTSRGPSYDPLEEPELWEKFVQFTHNQVLELATNYGRLDILWFDAGWVCGAARQDIRIEELMEKVRKVQPWILSADRTCGGVCENYVTPEQCVPDEPLGIPWESCVSMGRGFAYSFDDDFKPVRNLIHLLIDIVAKGGNLALNIAPQPDGRLPDNAIKRMRGMGEWLKVYGDAIYGTRVCAPYRKGNFAFTQKAAENKIFAFKLYPTDDSVVESDIVIPIELSAEGIVYVKNMKDGAELNYEVTPKGLSIKIPPSTGTAPIADAFEIKCK